MMKRLFNVIFFFCLLPLIGGCQKDSKKSCDCVGGPKMGQVLKINVGSEPQTLDPRKARALGDINTIKMFMEGLARVAQDGKAQLAMAESSELSEDQKTYTFTLRDTKWSNGDPVTAGDFIYAWKKALSPNFPSANANQLFVIKNAKSIKEGKLPSSFLGVRAKDDHTLEVELENPTPYFLELVTAPIFFPVNSKVDKINPHWMESPDTFICNGPFRLSEWRHHDKIVAARNNDYWDRKAVKLGEVEMIMVNEETGFKMFENDELHWQGSPHSLIPVDAVAALKKEEKLEVKPFLGTYWLRVNVESGPLRSPSMRKALALAVNRAEIVEHVTQGNQIPCTGIVPASMGLSEKGYFGDNDLETAKAYFEKGLEELGLTASDLPTITYSYSSSDRNHLIAQAIQQQWHEAFGIKVQLEAMENKVFFDRIARQNYQIASGSWIADFPDPINFLEVFQSKENGTNNTNWESPDYTELLEQSYTVTNPHERYRLLRKSEELLVEDMPVIPIFTFTMLYVKDDSVQNVVLTELGNLDFKWTSLKRN